MLNALFLFNDSLSQDLSRLKLFLRFENGKSALLF